MASVVLVVGVAGAKVVAGSAIVSPPPQIYYDYGFGNCDPVYPGSPCFGPPNTGLSPGDTTDLLVTVAQDDPQPNGTITITWPAGALIFVHNGDTLSPCTATDHSVTCTYTDFAHGFKSDTFTFKIGAHAPLSITAEITAATIDGTSPVADATVQLKPPPAQTFLRQQASPNVQMGGTISDSATLTGGRSPGGSITFQLFGPNAYTCTNVPAVATYRVAVNGNGTYNTPGYHTIYSGAYYWMATYSGDGDNLGAATPCGGMGGTVTVTQRR